LPTLQCSDDEIQLLKNKLDQPQRAEKRLDVLLLTGKKEVKVLFAYLLEKYLY
jgi:hypothetical protein